MSAFSNLDNELRKFVVERSVTSRKGENGILLIIGGSRIYHGAPILSSLAALRTGLDLVYTAVPHSNIYVTRSVSPNLIVLPIIDDDLTIKSVNSLLEIIPKVPDAISIGMGLSIKEPTALIHLVRKLLAQGNDSERTKLLLDASALIPEILEEIKETNTIITPHLGEYKRIFDIDISDLTLEGQISDVLKNADKYGLTIILKGYNNIICDKNSNVIVIKRSTPAMTVGGTGDVLSGVSSALLAKKNSPFYASVFGVYFVGLAASNVASKIGLHMVATDIIDELATVIKPFDKVKNQNNKPD